MYVMFTTNKELVPGGLRILPLLFLLIATPAFAADGAASAAAGSQKPNSELLQRLAAARTTDWNCAMDPGVSLIRQGTFLNQMNKADRAIKEIEHGFAVSPSEIQTRSGYLQSTSHLNSGLN